MFQRPPSGLRGALLAALLASALLAQTTIPPNIDAALADLIQRQRNGQNPFDPPATPGVSLGYSRLAQGDASGRVLIEVRGNGRVPPETLRQTMLSAGGAFTGEDLTYENGLWSLFFPFNSLTSLATATGVGSISLSYRPVTNVGAKTSEGVAVLKANVAHGQGFTGTGITVGVLSDSYNNLGGEAADIGSGDLPVLKYKKDWTFSTQTDEGRAMAQIVYDVAPGSSMCFATAWGGQAAFASNIRDLRTNALCRADVIVDDVIYFDEPMFSDGAIALAVNDVATKPTTGLFPGPRVNFFSAAGNQQGKGYTADLAVFGNPSSVSGINLGTIATCAGNVNARDYSGGLLDFSGGAGAYTTTMTLVAGQVLVMQWDDRFDKSPSEITTDLNFLFFQGGNCVGAIGSDNFAVNKAFETAGLNSGSATLTMMIARTAGGTKLAKRVKLVAFGGGISSPLFSTAAPVTFGHSAATGAISVAAYRFASDLLSAPPLFESFSSPGPVTISFDKFGTRLVVPEIRKKPDIAATDGGANTFFGPLIGGTRRFFGTSAAAPHAAGVAALLLQKAGGPASIHYTAMKSFLQTSAPARVFPYTSLPAAKGYSPFDGFGLIDAVAALNKVTPPPVCGGNPSTC